MCEDACSECAQVEAESYLLFLLNASQGLVEEFLADGISIFSPKGEKDDRLK